MDLTVVNPYWIIKNLTQENKELKIENEVKDVEIGKLNERIEELEKEIGE